MSNAPNVTGMQRTRSCKFRQSFPDRVHPSPSHAGGSLHTWEVSFTDSHRLHLVETGKVNFHDHLKCQRLKEKNVMCQNKSSNSLLTTHATIKWYTLQLTFWSKLNIWMVSDSFVLILFIAFQFGIFYFDYSCKFVVRAVFLDAKSCTQMLQSKNIYLFHYENHCFKT